MKTAARTVIPCYDRFAAHKRWAPLSLGLLGLAATLLALSRPATATPAVAQLPRVVISGKSAGSLAAPIVQLPRVVVQGYRQAGPQRVALHRPSAAEF